MSTSGLQFFNNSSYNSTIRLLGKDVFTEEVGELSRVEIVVAID